MPRCSRNLTPCLALYRLVADYTQQLFRSSERIEVEFHIDFGYVYTDMSSTIAPLAHTPSRFA